MGDTIDRSGRDSSPELASTGRPTVVRLADAAACDPSSVGSKARRLAIAARHGLPVVDGFVVPAEAAAAVATGDRPSAAQVVTAWRALSGDGASAVVVRSSSPAEDLDTRSAAGRYESVLHVRSEEELLVACRRVVTSGEGDPMAVLVQRQVVAAVSGVAFGVDPVSGRRDRRVVAVVAELPDRLVGGRVSGDLVTTNRVGRVISGGSSVLPRNRRRSVLRLLAKAGRLFGAAQDVEWAIDLDGQTWLLQTRPVTAGVASCVGPTLGAGPLAETFPESLSRLETDLWVAPLGVGLARALLLSGRAGRRQIARSPIVTCVGGWAVADLDLLATGHRVGWLPRLDPRPRFRRLTTAWRVGRLRAALPALIEDALEEVDERLAAVPALSSLDDGELRGLLTRSRHALAALHAQEVLAVVLVRPDATASAAGIALRSLAWARDAEIGGADAIARWPELLALAPPSLGDPALAIDGLVIEGQPSPDPERSTIAAMPAREALRLRTRWLQELTGRAAVELARRAGWDASQLAASSLDDLLAGRSPSAGGSSVSGPRPPARFRRTAGGALVPLVDRMARGDAAAPAGDPAGGGRGSGSVVHAAAAAYAGAVLVTDVLDPRLAPLVPRLAALVSETGSVLSHLAIVAREHGVPTVVAVPDARRRFPVGTVVVVDGATGEVREQ